MPFFEEFICAVELSKGLMYASSSKRLIRTQGRHLMPEIEVPLLPWAFPHNWFEGLLHLHCMVISRGVEKHSNSKTSPVPG
jgi:hypothetical protein